MAGGSTVFRPCACASSHRISKVIVFVVSVILAGLPSTNCQIEKLNIDMTDLEILVDQTHIIKLIQIGEYNTTLTVDIEVQHPDLLQFVPSSVQLPGVENPNTTVKLTHDICAYAKSPGHSVVTFNVTPPDFVNMDSVFLRVTLMHSKAIFVISNIMGWIYFVAWSISFYPQMYTNFKRKSVVGLNFDFLVLNILGFTLYSLFNCGLYYSKEIQAEYTARHPRSLNPVQLNDVFFSLHAALATLITISQCFMYERGSQRVSWACMSLAALFSCVALGAAAAAGAGAVAWLDVLYICSYVKLAITLIKYVPQAYMNYKRKSTVGWSIGNIFLDFTGGILSILQMLLNAYNYDDWISFFGDFTKFGLGMFSLLFDVFFILQHYVFYRHVNDEKKTSIDIKV